MKLMLSAVALVLVSAISTVAQSDFPKSKPCSFKYGGWAQAGGPDPKANVLTMKNDGGWCGHLHKTVKGSLVFGAPEHVVKQPTNGQVSVVRMDAGTNIYYKPNPGFTGTDNFTVVNEMFNIERPYTVIVRK